MTEERADGHGERKLPCLSSVSRSERFVSQGGPAVDVRKYPVRGRCTVLTALSVAEQHRPDAVGLEVVIASFCIRTAEELAAGVFPDWTQVGPRNSSYAFLFYLVMQHETIALMGNGKLYIRTIWII